MRRTVGLVALSMFSVAAVGCTEERDDPNSGEFLVDGHDVGYRTDLDDQGVGSMCLTLDGSEETCFVLDISLDEDLEGGGLVSTATARLAWVDALPLQVNSAAAVYYFVGTSGRNSAALVQMAILPPGGDTVCLELLRGLGRSVRVRTPVGDLPTFEDVATEDCDDE